LFYICVGYFTYVGFTGDVVTVHTDRESFQAKGLVITCGAWSSEILSDLGISLPLQVS